MLEAKDARQLTDRMATELLKMHTRWVLTRADLEIEQAVQHGGDMALVDTADLYPGAVNKAISELEALGYEAWELNSGILKIKW